MPEATSRLRVLIDFIVRNLGDVGRAGSALNNLLTDAQKTGITFLRTGAAVKKGTRGFLTTAEAIGEIAKIQTLSKMKMDAYKDMMETLRLTSDELEEKMRVAHIELKEGGIWWDRIRGKELSVREATGILGRTMKRFKFELLGVLFFGQQLERTLRSWLKPAMEAYGIFDMWNSMLMVAFIPTMEDLAPILYSIMYWFMDLPDPIKEAIGWLLVIGMVAGKVLESFAVLGLGIISLKFTFPWIVKLGGIFGITSTGIKGAVDGVIRTLAGVGPTTAITAKVAAIALFKFAAVAAIVGLIVYSVWKESQHAISLSQKMEMDKRKKDWDSFRTHALMRSIEMRSLIPRIIHRMLYTVGSIVLSVAEFVVTGLWEMAGWVLQAFLWLPKQILNALKEIPGIGDTFKSALEAIEKAEANFLTFHAQVSAEISRRFADASVNAAYNFEKAMQDMRYETTKQMLAMGIPIKEIIAEYGKEEGALKALYQAASEGKISMTELQKALAEQTEATESSTSALDILNSNIYNVSEQLKSFENIGEQAFTTLVDQSQYTANALTADLNEFISNASSKWNFIQQTAENASNEIQTNFSAMTINITDQLSNFQSHAEANITTVNTKYQESLNQMVNSTKNAVAKINSELDKIKKSITTTHTIIVKRVYRTFWRFGGFTFFQAGGIVMRPTLGVLGERGPEAVIPLRKLKGLGGVTINYNPTINITAEITQEIDIDRMMSKVDDYIVGKLKSMVH